MASNPKAYYEYLRIKKTVTDIALLTAQIQAASDDDLTVMLTTASLHTTLKKLNLSPLKYQLTGGVSAPIKMPILQEDFEAFKTQWKAMMENVIALTSTQKDSLADASSVSSLITDTTYAEEWASYRQGMYTNLTSELSPTPTSSANPDSTFRLADMTREITDYQKQGYLFSYQEWGSNVTRYLNRLEPSIFPDAAGATTTIDSQKFAAEKTLGQIVGEAFRWKTPYHQNLL